DVPEHEIMHHVHLAAEQLIVLQNRIAQSSVDRPEFVALRQQVLELLDRGDLTGARAMLRTARRNAHALSLSREEVELVSNEARIDQLQLDFRSAAARYAEAANLVAAFDSEGIWGLLIGLSLIFNLHVHYPKLIVVAGFAGGVNAVAYFYF